MVFAEDSRIEFLYSLHDKSSILQLLFEICLFLKYLRLILLV